MKKGWIWSIIGLLIGFVMDHKLKKRFVAEYEVENDELNKKMFSYREMLEKKQEEINRNKKDRDRYKAKWEIMYRWKTLTDNGFSLIEYFKRNKVYKLVIYGCGEIGELLIDELDKDGCLQIAYIIDQKKAGLSYKNIPIFSKLTTEDIDAIVVTPVLIKEQVKEYLNLQNVIKVIAIDELMEEEWKRHEMDK